MFSLYAKYVYQAKEAIKEAERCEPDNIFTQFSIYKIAVQENNVEKGIYKNLLDAAYIMKTDIAVTTLSQDKFLFIYI